MLTHYSSLPATFAGWKRIPWWNATRTYMKGTHSTCENGRAENAETPVYCIPLSYCASHRQKKVYRFVKSNRTETWHDSPTWCQALVGRDAKFLRNTGCLSIKNLVSILHRVVLRNRAWSTDDDMPTSHKNTSAQCLTANFTLLDDIYPWNSCASTCIHYAHNSVVSWLTPCAALRTDRDGREIRIGAIDIIAVCK